MRLTRLSIFFLSLAALLLSACSQPTAEPVTVRLEMSEYAFTPGVIEVQVGQEVTLELVNRGALSHELMIGREVLMDNDRPSGYQHDMFAEASVSPAVMDMNSHQSHISPGEHGHGDQAFMVTLPESGHMMTVTFTVTEEMVGEWELGCFEQDGVHYNAGMTGQLVVHPR